MQRPNVNGPWRKVSHGIHCAMRVEMTEVYREWINSLKDRAGRARIQTAIPLAQGLQE